MYQVINTIITGLNEIGRGFWDYAAAVFIQASLLIVLLLILDFILRKRVRAVFRYCLWMLLFIKLVLPASLTLPTGIGYWLGDYFPREDSIAKFTPHTETAVPMMRIDEVVPMVNNTPQRYVLDTYTMNERMPAEVELESISWQGLVFSGWLVGMLVLSVLVIRRFRSVRRLITDSKPANERSVEMLDECRHLMGIRQSVELRLSDNKLSPAVCGLFKPVILVPTVLLRKLSREKLRAVLIHELAHIKRCDAWVHLLQAILQIVYFYNPLVWIANAMVRRAREQAVDEMVLVTLRPETKNYSNMLIDIAEMAFWRPNFSLSIIGVVESKKALERRINHMLTRPAPKSSKLGLLRLIAIVAIGAILLPMGRNSKVEAAITWENAQAHSKTNVIIPGMRVGDYTFNMSKDDLLKSLGKPNSIFIDNKTYTLENLPSNYYMSFGDISFLIANDEIKEITALSPYYKLPNGLGVGDSEQKIEQAFGDDFHLREGNWKDYLDYENKGLLVEIRKKDKTVVEIAVRRIKSDHVDNNTPDQQEKSEHTIVPGVRVGDYTLNMRKDDVLKKLGEPQTIHLGEKKYSLNNLPSRYIMDFGDVSFWIENDSVNGISVHSSLYKLSSGLGVGDSEQKTKQAFGEDFQPRTEGGKDFQCYDAEGVAFEINKNNQTVSEIVIYESKGDRGERDTSAQQEYSKHTIVPGRRIGAYTLDMSKDDVLKKLGEPDTIHIGEYEVVHRGQEKYNLDSLTDDYILSFGDISFWFNNDSLEAISVRNPLYKLNNGLKVGDSEDRIKQAFGEDFQLEEALGRTFLCKHAKGVGFEIHKKNQTVTEIVVYHPQGHRYAPDQQEHSKQTIIPGVGIGDYTLGMSKDEVIRRLGEPGNIYYGRERYTLENLPRKYFMSFGDICFMTEDDTVTGIGVKSPLYKFTNGLGVGDSEEKIKQAFGSNFQLQEDVGKDQLDYKDKGLQFEIHHNDRIVTGIDVYQAEGTQQSDLRSRQDLLTTVRQAAADRRISFKLTTPDDFKAIVGRPTREWKDGDDIICLEYPGITARFFGKENVDIPYTLVSLSCEGKGIDIGQNRPVVLRNEGDLDKFGTFWGYSGVDLSRLDLSKKGDLLKTMSFDSHTVWPKPNRLPSDFDTKAVMEWGKYPGLGIKQLHDRGIIGKGVHVAIIDQPLLLDHIEYKDQLAGYVDIQTGDSDPSMHGAGVASLFVGKTCGVAPGAILHYWAQPSWKGDYKYRCMALEQIIQFNKGKDKSEQIRIVSVSKGFSSSEPNLDRWKTLLEQAKKSGIYVVHCASMGFGAGCRFLEDSDNPASYRLCAFYKGTTYNEPGCLFTPIDNRTMASPKAKDVYTFCIRGGLSWGAPYYAGVVALGMQVNPNLRPDQIEKLLYDSGWDFQRGKLINPVGFVEAARKAG